MKCKCGDPKCTTEIHFDTASQLMLVECDGRTIAVYLDANGCIELIQELRSVLDQMTRGE